MSAQIIDGKSIALKIRNIAALKVKELKEQGINPCLAVILAGNNPASLTYVKAKKKALFETGIEDRSFYLDSSVSENEILSLIEKLNKDKTVHGILVQLPLPDRIDKDKILSAINPQKDVDGFHAVNMGNLLAEKNTFIPCTAQGITVLLKAMNIETCGKHVVIVGRSNIVGKPAAVLLSSKEFNATVTLCHSKTKDLQRFTKEADILIAAAGRPHLIKEDMVKKGAAVIDAGVTRIPDSQKNSGFRLSGDVDFEKVKEKASFITPVPGGVGPMTIAMLILNTIKAAEISLKN